MILFTTLEIGEQDKTTMHKKLNIHCGISNFNDRLINCLR